MATTKPFAIQIVDVETDEFADAQPAGVEQFQHRPVAQVHRVGVVGGHRRDVHEFAGRRLTQYPGERLGFLGRLQPQRRILRERAPSHRVIADHLRASAFLVADGVFAETHLVLCRNVLIYFTRALQDRVIGLFADSLVRGGYLLLGTKENLRFSEQVANFDTIDDRGRIYRRRA